MSDTTKDPEAAAVLAKFNKAIAGMENDWPASQTSIVYQQVTYTPVTFLAKLQQEAAALAAVPAARSTLTAALANRHTALPGAIALIDAFFAMLPQFLPPGADVTQFGSKPRKVRAKPSAAQTVVSNEKRAATRTARHIMGKKQRLAIQAPAPTASAPAATAAEATTPAAPAATTAVTTAAATK